MIGSIAAGSLSLALLLWPGGDAPAVRRKVQSRTAGQTGPNGGELFRRYRDQFTGLVLAMTTVVLGGWPVGMALALPVGACGWLGSRWRRIRVRGQVDPLAVAAGWDLLAACLRAGQPVPTAIAITARGTTGAQAETLRVTAELLALGASAEDAWAKARDCPSTAELARAATRTARSGAALAVVATDLAERARADAEDHAEARAQRAAVWITGPLGCCFLPAFLCLGVAPVVAGLVARLATTW